MHLINKHHANKIIGAVALVSALLIFLSVLAGVVSTDSYSLAAQAQANGDIALMHLTLSDDLQRDNNATQFAGDRDHPVLPQ